jgi:hypothetical protein
MTWPTHLRTLLVVIAALALFGGAVTQMIGHLLRYDPRLGAGLFEFAGVRVYAPWAALSWAAKWALHAPWFALLTSILVVSCMLAAYAVAIVFAELEPIAPFAPSPQSVSGRNLASWRELGDCGLLEDEGLPLGAVRHHGFAKHDFLRFPRGHYLILGDPKVTDAALIAALSGWNGALVMIDARGLSDRLRRQNVLRVAPGRADSAAINPLFAIRGGGHAWSDASAFADAFQRLDQLLTAPREARNLAALRRRMIDKQTTLAELCARWALTAFPASFPPAAWEMARVARMLRDHLDYGVQALACIDDALGLFAEPAFAQATTVHHLHFTDLVVGGGPQTLVISLDAVDAKTAAPLLLGLLAQLAAACADGLAYGARGIADEPGNRRMQQRRASQARRTSETRRVALTASPTAFFGNFRRRSSYFLLSRGHQPSGTTSAATTEGNAFPKSERMCQTRRLELALASNRATRSPDPRRPTPRACAFFSAAARARASTR